MIPPQNFKPAGNVEFARMIAESPPFTRKTKYTGKRAAGIIYERKAQKHLEFLYPETYVPGPWIYFREEGSSKHRWCQPDGLVIDVVTGVVTCVEIKYNHTSDAWFQVKKLYQPVLRHIFPTPLWKHQCCEVVKWYDPAVRFPEPTQLTTDITRDTSKFKVNIWRP